MRFNVDNEEFDTTEAATPVGRGYWQGIVVVALLWIVFGLLIWAAAGCKSGNAVWNVKNGRVGTQLEIGWVSSNVLKIGFPGEIVGDAKGAGELKGEPVPVSPSEPTP